MTTLPAHPPRTLAAPSTAWYVAGGLGVASVFLALLRTDMMPALIGVLSPLALVAAIIVLALGLPGGGSIVARRPLGVAALLVLAAAVFVDRILIPWLLISQVSVNSSIAYWALTVVQVIAAVVAAREIYVAGAVTGNARYVAFGAIAASILLAALSQIVGRVAVSLGSAEGLLFLQNFAILRAAVTVLVGVLLIIAADRARSPERVAAVSTPSAYVGGGLFLVAALIGGYVEVPLLVALLFAAGAGVLALGSRGLPSVTGRQNPGTVALIALGVWAVIVAAIGQSGFGEGLAMAQPVLAHAFGPVVGGVLAAIAAQQVLRSGAVVPRWNRVPMIVLAVLAALFVVGEVASTLGAMTSIYQFTTLTQVMQRGLMIALVVLGGWALLLGDRRSRA